jgi:hypothetical protein
MLGMSHTVRLGRTVQFEFMQFRISGYGALEFVAFPSGQRRRRARGQKRPVRVMP